MNKYLFNGAFYHQPLELDPYAQTVQIDNEKLIDSHIVYVNNKLYLIEKFAKCILQDEMPAWMKDETMIRFEKRERVVGEIVDGELVVEFETLENSHHDSVCEVIDFLMDILYEKNRYLYKMLTKSTTVTYINSVKLMTGLIGILQNPKKMTVIETMAKTIGEKMAIHSIQNDIEVASGKKAAILSQDQLHSIKTLKLDNSLVSFQRMVQNNVLSIDQMDEIIQGLKYLIKFKFITHSELDSLISRYEDDMVEKKINLEVVLDNTIKSFFNYYDISGRARRNMYGYYSCNQTFKSIFSHYMDAINMLPKEHVVEPKYYRTNDVERYHGITTRNCKIFQVPRPAEFKAAATRLRKLHYDNGEYVFSPFQTEEELFFVGQQYNNCLPIYRDKIIDDGAILVCAYKKTPNGLEECPDFVFEVTPHLDVLEISTYNNEEVKDPDKIEAVREFRKAKWYLLSKGRNVYRAPDDNEDDE